MEMEEGAAAENPTAPVVDRHDEGVAAPMVAPEEAVVADQHAEGSTVPTAVTEEAVGAGQRTEGSRVPMVVTEEAVGVGQRIEGSTVPMAVTEEAVGSGQRTEGSTVPMVVTEEAVGAGQHTEASTVSMVVPEEAVGGDQHSEGLTLPMAATEEAADGNRHADGSIVSMVVPEEAVSDKHVEASTVPMVVREEAADADKHVEASTEPMVVPEEAVDVDQHVEGVTAPMVVPEAAADMDHHIEDAVTQDKHEDTDGIINVTPEEMRGIIEVIAETGKFWHEWSFLKRLLSLQLMQALGEYSEVQMVIRDDGQQQNSLSTETHSELFSQLNDALLRFEEGPPFTLQRLCEILLDPKGTYKKLSKLAWALEKTLLVTSTITKCTDPYPAAHGPNPEAISITSVHVEPEKLPEHPAVVSNGTEHAEGDGDEEMADAEAEAVPGSHDDVEMQEEKPDHIADVNLDTSSGAAVACETAVAASEQSPEPHS